MVTSSGHFNDREFFQLIALDKAARLTKLELQALYIKKRLTHYQKLLKSELYDIVANNEVKQLPEEALNDALATYQFKRKFR